MLATIGLSLVATPALARSVRHDIDPYEEMLARNRLYAGALVQYKEHKETHIGTVVDTTPFQYDRIIINDIKLKCCEYNLVLVKFTSPSEHWRAIPAEKLTKLVWTA
jgi:hypothetical protein